MEPENNPEELEKLRTAIELIYQDLARIDQRLADLAGLLREISVPAKPTGEAATARQLANLAAANKAVLVLAQRADALLKKQPEGTAQEVDHSFYYGQREKKKKEIEKHLAYLRFLSSLKQVKTTHCRVETHQHQGISFIDAEGQVVEENVCPQSWWVSLSHLAYVDGTLKDFSDATPLSVYLGQFTIQTKTIE